MSAVVQIGSRQVNTHLAALRLIGSGLVAFGVFLSGFVPAEPAPYELFMAGQVAIWFLLGLKISRSVAPILVLFLLFNIGGLFSMTVMKDITGAPMYFAVSTFLALTSVFYAAIIENDQRRLSLIFKAWAVAAVLTSILGILGYFHAFPGAQVFTRYDRAMGAFQDPNVFGPYLVAPTLYLMYRLLSAPLTRAWVYAPGIMILTLGVFLSFSRAAWGLFAFCVLALIVVMLLKERTAAFRMKIFTLSIAALVLLILAIGGALQSKKVDVLFLNRAKLVQSYDGARLGRFERHKIGFLMAMERPLGLGPMVLGKMFGEDEHNMWLKSLTTYGWLGFVCYITLLWSTVALGFRYLLRDRPWQPYLMIAWIVLIGHAELAMSLTSTTGDTCTCFYGILWGCFALEQRHQMKAVRSPAAAS